MILDLDGNIINKKLNKNDNILFLPNTDVNFDSTTGNYLFNTYSEKIIIIWGTSKRTAQFIDDFNLDNRILYYVDKNAERWGKKYNGYDVYSPSVMINIKDCIVICVVPFSFSDIYNDLIGMNLNFYLFTELDSANQKMIKCNKFALNKKNKYRFIHMFPNLIFFQSFYNMILEFEKINEHLFVIDNYTIGDFSNNLQFILKYSKIYKNIIIIDDVNNLPSLFYEKNQKYNYNKKIIDLEISDYITDNTKFFFHSFSWKKNGILFIKNIKKHINNLQIIIWEYNDINRLFEYKNIFGEDLLEKTIIYSPQKWSNDINNVLKVKACLSKNLQYKYIKYINNKIKNTDNSVRILLGHSAYENDKHLIGFDLIKKYKKENIKIISPLSYGESGYAKNVVKKGTEIFNDKFYPILNFMNNEDYYSLLLDIDIAVFPMETLAASTTISFLSYFNKKIYLNKKVKEVMDSRGIKSYDISEIKKMSFEKFCKNVKMENKNISEYNIEGYRYWLSIFEN